MTPAATKLTLFVGTGHIADKAIQVIRCKADPVTGLTTPPTTPVREGSDEPLPPLENFIKSLVRKSKCHIPTLLCTLVYLDRLKFRLPPRSTGSPSTRHRVFLATLIVAAKYLNGEHERAQVRSHTFA